MSKKVPVVYLAARYGRRAETLARKRQLEAKGVPVTSTWLDGPDQRLLDGRVLSTDLEQKVEAGTDDEVSAMCAAQDVQDVAASDVLVLIGEAPEAARGRGGRHVEFGIALALGKRIILVGHREHVFHCLPAVEFARTWEDAVDLVLAGGQA